MILELITNALGVVGGWFSWKSSGVKQHTDAEAIVNRDEQAVRDRKQTVNKAVHEGDEETINRLINGLAILWLMVIAASVVGCASEYQLGSLRDDMRNGDKALWRYDREQDERIQTLERRVYHLERGELLDHPAKGETK